MKNLISILCVAAALVFFTGVSNAQISTNGSSGLAGSYPDLASAITALNGATITSPVIISVDVGNPQTAPAGGYVITATGTVTNTITLTGNGNTITANAGLTAGNLNDAIFRLSGSDYVTIQGFSMQENAANTTTAAATNNMTEWGVALLYASATDGCQNVTIQNNTITLNRTYQNTFAIYSNSTHTFAAVTTSVPATGATGGNHNLKIYGNTISNVNQGIVVVGTTAAADQNTGLDIGGSSLAQGNSITNYGTTGTFSAYANVSGTVNGILIRNSNGFNCSYNTVTSSVGGVTAGTLYGIQQAAASVVPTTTFTNNITYNSISLKSGLASGAMNGINVPAGSASTTSTFNITNNDFNNFGHTVSGTGVITYIVTASVHLNTTISNNTFTNMTVNTTGSVTFISQTFTLTLAGGTKTVSGNSIVTGFSKTGAGGTILCVTDNGSSTTVVQSNCTNNNFSNITVTGATTLTGLSYTDGGTAPSRTVTGNTISNWTGGTSAINCMNFTYWSGSTSTLNTNTISNVTGQGAVTGITIGSTVITANPMSVSNNTINNLSSTGTGGAVTGITCSNTSPVININGNTINTLSSTGASLVSGISVSGATNTSVYKNKIYDLTGSNASSTVSGVTVSGGTLVYIYNNLVGDLKAPSANAANPVNGINISGGTTVNVANNTVYIAAASAGALFGSSAINASTTPTVTLNNNIFVNNSTSSGAGLTVAYRRSTTTLTTYGALSNNNDFFASTIFTDGTNTDILMSAYKTRVASRDAASFSESPNFRSTAGSNANYLKIDSTIATQLEGSASIISTPAITSDYYNIARYPNAGYPFNASYPPTAPDIGANEFGGIPIDLVPPVITYTTLSATGSTSDRTLANVSITDASGVPTTGALQPRIYYKKNAGSYFSSQGSKTSGTGQSGVWSFTIVAADMGGVAAADVISYFVIAQDIAPGGPFISSTPGAGLVATDVNTVTTPPTTPSTYTITAPSLSGSYTIGTTLFRPVGGGKLEFEARTRTVRKVISSKTDFATAKQDVKPGTQVDAPAADYEADVTETYFVPVVNGKEYSGSLYHEYTKEEKTQLGLPDNMVGDYATLSAAITDLNTRGVGGATTFSLTDASYTEAATLTISITNEAVTTASNTVTFKPAASVTPTITVTSTGVAINIANSYVTFDGSNSGGTSRDMTLINAGAGANSGCFSTGFPNVTIKNMKTQSTSFSVGYGILYSGVAVTSGTIQNNDVQKAVIGIQIQAGTSNVSITGNSIGSVDSLSKVTNGGIIVLSSTNFTINNNTIVGVSRNATNSTSGIQIAVSGSPSPSGGNIYNNIVSNVKHSGFNSAAYAAYGIYLGTDIASSNISVYNNSIYDILTQGDGSTAGTTYAPHGIYIATGGGYKIYYNSISLYGTITDPDATALRGGCITVEAGTNVGTLDIRNNILQNTQTMTVPAAVKKTYAFISVAANTAYSNLDYNDYYVSGVDGVFGFANSADQSTITAWRTFTGKDVNSISTDPFYVSATNLTPQTYNVKGKGYPIATVSTDILGTARSTSITNGPTDPGAYQFTPVFNAVSTMVQSIVGNGTYGFSFGGTTYGWINITNYTGDMAAFDISWIHYQGVNPPGSAGQQFNAAYDSIWVSNGSLGTSTYDVQIFVPKNNLRNIADTNNIILAKSNDGGASWNAAPGTTNGYIPGNPGFAYANGLTSFSLFAVTSTDNPLPVELASFTSLIDKRNVELKWSTSKEENNAGFDIERKLVNENSWSKAGNIQGAGTSNTVKNYSFEDRNLASGKYNYRLKQIDFNGNHKYFNLSSEVVVGVPAKFELSQNYPNPFNPSTKINYDLPFDSKVQIKVFDMTGREVAQIVNETKTAGYYTAQFNASAMASGVYFYTITATGGSQSFVKTMKMVLVK
ncbi:MAG: hypothetical protein JSS63_02195 [Bacteroidetes bacterium]|nr:hypothetical protein [Bacteroidota bacterium]